ncbi:hypothetical protein N9296_03760 [Amylibacter sp.]|nr:hypothetical protein [Amylibacter sp.]
MIMEIFTKITCISIGLISGIFGFKWAVETHTELLPAYTLASIIYIPIHTIILSIVSKNKDRLTKIHTCNTVNIPLKFSVSIYAILIILACLTGIIFNQIQIYISLIALNLIFGLAQIASFIPSSKEQIHDINRFWKIQTIAGIVRFISIIIFLKIFLIGFHGLLLSNISAAITVLLMYRVSLKSILIQGKILKSFPKNLKKILSVDGFLRAVRLNLEPYSILVLCSAIAYASTAQIATVILSAINYLNATATATRILYSTIERDALYSKLNKKKHINITVQCALLCVAAIVLSYYDDLNQIVLPTIPYSSYIFYAIAAYFLIFPITIGFGFSDYFPNNRIRSFIKLVLLQHVIILSIIWIGAFDLLLKFKVASIIAAPILSCVLIYVGMVLTKKSV